MSAHRRPRMSARRVLEVMIRTDRGSMTVWSPDEVRQHLDAYRTEVLAESADEVARLLADEPDDNRAFALYEALTRLRAKLPCTCARSQGLHEKRCPRHVPGHDLLSPAKQLARAREELRPAAEATP